MISQPAPPPPLAVHLRGERVQFAPLDKAAHLENYVRWFNDPEVTRYMLQVMPLTRLAEEAFFERVAGATDAVTWAVHDEHGRHIGGTGLHKIDWRNRCAESGIIIGDREAWGKGYGTEVMRVRTKWAFEELGLHRIESQCFADNVGSATCLGRAGYRRIGVARQRQWKHGRWHDILLWEILDEDYFGRRGEA